MVTTVLILPGIGNSGSDHWQSLWERTHPSFQRIQQRDWDNPNCAEWVETLDRTVASAQSNLVLAAHSLACLVVAHWAASSTRKIKGALLVAPPDPQGPNFPKQAVGFSPVPMKQFAFASIVVASANDPYGGLECGAAYASAWGSRYVNGGALGHINAASGLGEWHVGFSLLHSLVG